MPLLEDARTALGDLRVALSSGEAGCHIFLFAKRTRQRSEEWHRVALAADLADRFVEGTRTTILDIEARAGDAEAMDVFNFDAMASGSIGVARLSDVIEIGQWLDSLPPDDHSVRFNGDEAILEKSRFYGARINLEDGRILKTFRSRRGLNVIVRTQGAIAAFFSRDSQEMVAVDGTVVSFDANIDFFEWDGLLFIVNLTVFETITNVRDITIRKAHEAVDSLSARFDLPDIETLKSKVGERNRLAKRLAAAHQYTLFDDIDFQRLSQRIEAKGLAVGCELMGDRCQIHFNVDDRQEVEDFVNLISDFYLRSEVTGREYDAIVKRPSSRRR